jgi:hypothetical protein
LRIVCEKMIGIGENFGISDDGDDFLSPIKAV